MNPKNIPLSVIILAKNESVRITSCLRACSWASERIVVDNGSDDDTAYLAKKEGAEVLSSTSGDFSFLRNLGAQQAHEQWVLYIDADELLQVKFRDEISHIIESFDPETDPHAYHIIRVTKFLGHPWPHRDRVLRLFYRPSFTGWKGKIHETGYTTGAVGTMKTPVLHDTHRTLDEMVAKTNVWSTVEAQLRYEVNHPPVVPWRLGRVMVGAFWKSFVGQGGWKAGTVGWIESLYQAFSMFITYAKLWEKQVSYKER